MTSVSKDPVLVVLQLTGGNDYMNTVVPYDNPLYYDNRPTVNVAPERVLPLDSMVGFNPTLAPIKDLYDQGDVAVVHGVGYSNPNRSHFRSMDIWHTCEPDKIGTEGWLGKVIRDLDPRGENVLTGVNFGRGLPRAMALPGVPVASVAVLENYGLLTAIPQEEARARALDVFARMYTPAMGTGPTMDYLGQTGLDALKGADILRTAPEKYTSTVEYGDNAIARNLRAISQVLLADLGTRVFYTQHGGYDTHAAEMAVHTQLWTELSEAISCFFADLREHDVEDRVVMLVFTEFGRRVKDNGSGTDHGSGGLSMVMGAPVKGGQYNEFPSMKEGDLLEGDLHFNYDYRGLYGTLAERWLGLDATSIVGGNYEMLDVV
ncbi:MAG: DUF1501 domain-containing protein [Chloroflexi bacterium]|nr:DUF1501 domain-containing protein [Chloroflexota bacterium]